MFSRSGPFPVLGLVSETWGWFTSFSSPQPLPYHVQLAGEGSGVPLSGMAPHYCLWIQGPKVGLVVREPWALTLV